MIQRYLAIFWKEWKSLQPFYYLLLALFFIGLIMVQFERAMDEYPIWEVLADPSGTLFITMILCFVASMGLLTREKDEGTLQYLDGLPVSRFSLYVVKGILAFALVTGVDLLWTLEGLVYEFLSRESDSPATPWGHVGTFLFLNTFLVAYFIAVLLPLSFMRLWSIIVIGLILIGLFFLQLKGVPYADWLSPLELMQPPTDIEDAWPIPWGHLATLSVIGAVSWIIGLIIYLNREPSRARGLKNFCDSTLGKVILVGCIAGLAIVGIVLTAVQMERSGTLEEYEESTVQVVREPVKEENRIASSKSEKFEFLYRKRIEDEVTPLVESSDEIFDVVADFLLADEAARKGVTVVDMSNPLGSHNAGQAYWNKIRMLFPEKDLPEAKAVLGHEVAHVLMERISNGQLGDAFLSTRWFHEGLASYIEFEYFREEKESVDYDRWLALSSSWNEVNFIEMVFDPILSSKRDQNIAYPAGLEWIRAAVDIYGEDCPAKLVSAIGRPDAANKLRGIELWRDTCLAAGYDLERIRGRFRVRLKDLRNQYKEICSQMPEVKEAKVTRSDGKIVVDPELPEGWKEKAPAKAKLICRIRPDTDSTPNKWRYSKLNDDDTFKVSALTLVRPKIHYQIGWLVKGWAEQPVYGEWVEVDVENVD